LRDIEAAKTASSPKKEIKNNLGEYVVDKHKSSRAKFIYFCIYRKVQVKLTQDLTYCEKTRLEVK
ncbi:1427_t:CDS:1, partial [Gigaspora margarita]